MSKSTLPICITENLSDTNTIAFVGRTIEVPCRLPQEFNFMSGKWLCTALLSGDTFADYIVDSIESESGLGAGCLFPSEFAAADAKANTILATIKATLGITGPVPPGSPLPAIALAYEAECAAYDACVKADASLPNILRGEVILMSHPSDEGVSGVYSRAARMLAKYVEHVVENACKAQTERAESQAKEDK